MLLNKRASSNRFSLSLMQWISSKPNVIFLIRSLVLDQIITRRWFVKTILLSNFQQFDVYLCTAVSALCGKVLVMGGLQGLFLWEAARSFPYIHWANASQLQDGPAAGQGQAHQWRWYHLCDNILKKKKKNLCNGIFAAGKRSENVWEKQLCRHWGQWMRGRRCSRH